MNLEFPLNYSFFHHKNASFYHDHTIIRLSCDGMNPVLTLKFEYFQNQQRERNELTIINSAEIFSLTSPVVFAYFL